MTTALDVLRHLWFRGPDCFAPSHTMVWRHAESIAGTAKYPQEHVSAARLKIAISSATRPATATRDDRRRALDSAMAKQAVDGGAPSAADLARRTAVILRDRGVDPGCPRVLARGRGPRLLW
jgi:hypothetical protein